MLDGAIANVALPTIARDLHASPASSIWVVNAYQLAVTISLLPLASLGDIYGYRRVYQYGLVVFTIASLGCALSDSLLDADPRAHRPGLRRGRHHERQRRAGPLHLSAPAGSAAASASTRPSARSRPPSAPPSPSAILSVAHWPWLFAVNVPLGVIAIPIALRALPQATRADRRIRRAERGLERAHLRPADQRHRAAWATASSAAAWLAPNWCVAVVLGFVLVTRQLSQRSPLLPVDLLRIPLFALSVATSVCAFAAQGMALVSLPFLFENTLGRGQVQTGLLLTPWPLTVAVIAPFTGRLSDRYPAGLLSGDRPGGAGDRAGAGGAAAAAPQQRSTSSGALLSAASASASSTRRTTARS